MDTLSINDLRNFEINIDFFSLIISIITSAICAYLIKFIYIKFAKSINNKENFSDTFDISSWQSKCLHMNKKVLISDNFDKCEGIFLGITPRGEAIIENDQETKYGEYDCKFINPNKDINNLRVTVDYQEDLNVARKIAKIIREQSLEINADTIYKIWLKEPEIFKENDYLQQDYLNNQSDIISKMNLSN